MPNAIKRRIVNIVVTQYNAVQEFNHVIKTYLLKHGYCSSSVFTKPSKWVDIKTLRKSSELSDFEENEITSAINELEQEDKITINHEQQKIKHKRF